jgi:hypothetical protein
VKGEEGSPNCAQGNGWQKALRNASLDGASRLYESAFIPMSHHLTRRDFITFSAAAAALLGFAGCTTLAQSPRKPRPIAAGAKIRVAQIGCGGKGFSDIMAHKDEEVVSLCDIDWEGLRPRTANAKSGKEAKAAKEPQLSNVKKLMQEFPDAKRYTDFRKMLLEMDDKIDAVGIATPDHMHFLPAYMAIMMGKHVYIQKPLTPTVGEARNGCGFGVCHPS